MTRIPGAGKAPGSSPARPRSTTFVALFPGGLPPHPHHHELHDACYHSKDGAYAALKILLSHNYSVTMQQVQAVFDQHRQDMDNHLCGLSLPSMIVNQLAIKHQ